MFRYVDSILLLAFLSLTIGCGQSGGATTTVQGAVSVDGQPIKEGMISFSPVESGVGTAVSAEIRDGRYEAEGVPLGDVLVRFHAMEETGKTVTDAVEGDSKEMVDLIPPKYRDGIPLAVSESTEPHDFELVSR